MTRGAAADLLSKPVLVQEPLSAPYSGRLMFTQSWEDPECDLAALRPQRGERLLAITSGGDNVLGFLLNDPERLISVDLNPAQTFLLELKMAAFRRLPHDEMLAFLGVQRSAHAEGLYQGLRGDLTSQARHYWDERQAWFNRGLLTQGGFERYFALVRTMLRIVVGRKRLDELFTLEPEEQRKFYEQEWNTRRWRALVGILCSKFVLGRRLDPSWFTHAEVSSFGKHFTRLVEHAVAELPAWSNYFLAQIFLGRYLNSEAVPEYLKAANFQTIRDRLERVEAITCDIGEAIEDLEPHSIDCFALSNVFEYSPRELFERTCGGLLRAARPGARFALRNLVAPRRLQDVPGFIVDQELSSRLRDADRGFIYSRFEAATLAGNIVSRPNSPVSRSTRACSVGECHGYDPI
jgi:S-adenosylmethionine-diacylglycerol 3-amino-3-carboxypropyl transferase